MLEHSCLQVACWTSVTTAGSAPVWTRSISDAAGNPLGFVRFQGRAKASWFSWLRGARLEVYETDDVSHLMTVVRSWGMTRTWKVLDADERRVGFVYPTSLVDATGARRGSLDRRDRILDPAGQVLASFRKSTPLILEVTFAADQAANPFLRMLLLAGILAQDSSPVR